MTIEERQAREILASELLALGTAVLEGAGPQRRTELRRNVHNAEKRLADQELQQFPAYNPQHGGGTDWMTDERIGRRERLSL